MKLSLKQTLLIIVLILTPVLLSLLPFFIQSYLSPVDRVFMGLHRWSEDYYGYLQSINQGLMGHLTNVSKLTNEPHQPTFVHSEYVILGFIGRFFGLNAPLVYHLSRLFLGSIFVFIAFYFLYFLTSLSLRGVPLRGTTKQSSSKTEIATATSWPRNDRMWFTILAFFLAFFVGGFPHITSLQPLHIEPYLSWWTELDVLTRSTILPHYLMGNIFFLLILILFLKLQHIKYYLPNTKYYLLLLLCSFLLAFVHPIDFLILICSLGTFVVLNIIIVYVQCHSRAGGNLYNIDLRVKPEDDKVNKLSIRYKILLLLLILISGLLPALYYRYALSLPFWRFILAHGTTTSYNIPLFDLSIALGPVFFLGIGGIIIFLVSLREVTFMSTERDDVAIYSKNSRHSGEPEGRLQNPTRNDSGQARMTNSIDSRFRGNDNIKLLLFSWLFVQTLFFLKFYQIFNFDRLRTMEAPFYIPLAFFATYFITSLRGVRLWRTTKQSSLLMRLPRPFGARNDIALIVLIFLITLPTTIIGLKTQIFALSDFKTFSLFSYPTIKQYQSWQFLRNNTPDNSTITTLYEAKFLLPTVSGNKIAFGANFDNDPNYQNNVNKVNQMYAGSLSVVDAQNFLQTNQIQYVYWGYQEQSLGGDLTKYPFLQKIFSNGEVTIFKVK